MKAIDGLRNEVYLPAGKDDMPIEILKTYYPAKGEIHFKPWQMFMLVFAFSWFLWCAVYSIVLMTPTRTYYDNISYAYTYAELIEAVRTCTSLSEWMARIGLLYPNRIPDIVFNNAFNFWFEL